MASSTIDAAVDCRRASAASAIRLVALIVASMSLGCTAKINDAGDSRDSRARVGEVGLSLTFPPEQSIESAVYTITRRDGFYQSGEIPAGTPGRFSALFALPEAQGYTLELAAMSMGLRCVGSKEFDVWANRRVSLSIVLRCPAVPGDTGSVDVEGTLNQCPVAHGIAANPLEGAVGDTVRLYGSASDADGLPSPLIYTWRSDSGVLSGQRQDSIGFTCTKAGLSIVTLAVSDGDKGCARASASLAITCLDERPAAGSGSQGGFGGAGPDASIPRPEPDEDAGLARESH